MPNKSQKKTINSELGIRISECIVALLYRQSPIPNGPRIITFSLQRGECGATVVSWPQSKFVQHTEQQTTWIRKSQIENWQAGENAWNSWKRVQTGSKAASRRLGIISNIKSHDEESWFTIPCSTCSMFAFWLAFVAFCWSLPSICQIICR